MLPEQLADPERGEKSSRGRSGYDGWTAASCLLVLAFLLAWSTLLMKWLWDLVNIVASALAGWL